MSKTTETTPGTEVALTSSTLALPTDDPWAAVESGYVGVIAPTIAPVIPRLQFNANMGFGFVDEMTGEVITEGGEVRAVWLAWSESRSFWLAPFGTGPKDAPPDCRSVDMVKPDADSPDVQSSTCAACPNSQWSTDAQGRRLSPACGVRLNVLLWLVDEQRITRTWFHGIAAKHVARLLGYFAAKKRPPMSHLLTIRVATEDTDFGKKLVPEFHVGEAIPFEEARPLITARDEFLAQWRSLLAEDLSSPEADGAAVPQEKAPFIDPDDPDGAPF